MSYHPSRRAYTDTSDSGHATYDDYQDTPCRPLRYREYETRHKVTVTRYRIHTSGESSTSYHDQREYTVHGSHPFSSVYHTLPDEGYRDPSRGPRGDFGKREASSKHLGAEYTYSNSPKREFRRRGAQKDGRHGQSDRRYSSDDDATPEKRNARGYPSSAEEQRGHTSNTYAEHPQQEGLKPVHRGGYPGIPRSHGSNKYGRGDNHCQNKPNNSTRRHGRKHDNSRSETRRQEYSRSNRNDPYYEDCEQSYHRGPKPSQPQETKPTSRDGYSSKTEGYSYHRFATKDEPSQGKPESGSSRRQEKAHSSRSESRREGIPRNNRESSSHEIPQSQPKAKDNLPDHYATLKLDYLATKGEIKSAAKRRRVEVHPDKFLKLGMSDSERDRIHEIAVMVGQAADLLQDPEQKLRYDRKFLAAKGLERCGK